MVELAIEDWGFCRSLVEKVQDNKCPELAILDWGYFRSLVEKVQENKCIELAIKEKLLWGPRSVVSSSLKGEVC